MRRKWIVAGGALLAAVAGAAMMATTVFGGGAEPRADVAVVDVKMQAAESPSSQRATKAQKPKVIYLDGAPARSIPPSSERTWISGCSAARSTRA